MELLVKGIGDHGCEYMTGGIAVILGKIGRNFAAGMSGGIAYIYNEKGIFDEKKFNLEMVELENLKVDDEKNILSLIKSHYDYTNSQLAKKIIDDWSNSSTKFIKVMPTDYKKALELMSQSKTEKSF